MQVNQYEILLVPKMDYVSEGLIEKLEDGAYLLKKEIRVVFLDDPPSDTIGQIMEQAAEKINAGI